MEMPGVELHTPIEALAADVPDQPPARAARMSRRSSDSVEIGRCSRFGKDMGR